MKDRLRQVPWRRWLLVPIAIASVVYVGVAQDLTAAILAVVGIVAAVFTVWNPFEARPKPHLALRPVDGEETTSLTVNAVLRPVDVDAVVEEALELARALATSTGFVAMTEFAPPTDADHEKFEEALTSYADDVRAWAESGDSWLRQRAMALVADVVQHNPTSVDAVDAGIHLFFPPSTVEYEETEPPEAPERPAFPRRRSVLGALRGSAFADPTPLAMTRPSLTVEAFRPNLDGLRFGPVDAPDYEDTPDGGLEVFYGRWTIRHRESRAAGDEPFGVVLPAGEHQVPWEVRATNLPHHAKGTWTVSVQVESGNPIKTTAQLDDALQGKPEVSTADRHAALQKLLRDRRDSDRSDAASASSERS